MSCSGTDTMSGGVALSTTRGDSFGFLLRVWADPDKTMPSDLSEAAISAQVRETPDSEAIAASFHVGVVTNEVTLSLLPSETAELPPLCVWDIEIDWDGAGTSVQTVARGTLSTTPDVTRGGGDA